MAVVLDVVYNHFGPDGNVFPDFGHYLTETYKTDWGPALNFDGKRLRRRPRDGPGQCADVGPRLPLRRPPPRRRRPDLRPEPDADPRRGRRGRPRGGRPARQARPRLRRDRHERRAAVPRPSPIAADIGLDGQWNDDFHHAAHVVLTGETNGYYADFADGPAALAKVYERVFVNDGNYSPFRDRRHGAPATEFPGDRFLAFTQNHDQVGNRLKSDRYAASLPPRPSGWPPGILLLAPRIPLLFMGEEYGETNPFPFFCDFESPDLIKAVREGRKAEFAHFGWEAEPPDPVAASTRDSAVLSWSWDDPVRAGLRSLYRDLLRLRREAPALRDFHHARAA